MSHKPNMIVKGNETEKQEEVRYFEGPLSPSYMQLETLSHAQRMIEERLCRAAKMRQQCCERGEGAGLQPEILLL
jgi:hypothetical protein